MASRQWRAAAAILGLGVVVGACGRSIEDTGLDGAGSTGGSAAGTGGDRASTGGTSTGGTSTGEGGAGTVESAAGDGSSVRITPSVTGGTGGGGGTVGQGVGTGTGAEAFGGASQDSECNSVWGEPASDPNYRGIRGTLNGQPLSVDASDTNMWIAFCPMDGPGTEPVFDIYFSTANKSFRLQGCAAHVTAPNDTAWRPLQMTLSAAAAMPILGLTDFEVDPANPAVSGHVTLQGDALDGPVDLDADFYLDASIENPCAPKID